LCHEKGCPESYKDQIKECKWCGFEFQPETKNQVCCDLSCTESYLN